MKIGTVEFATAAMPESMCCSPHAISVNGIAPLTTPIAKPAQPVPLQLGDARRACRASATRNSASSDARAGEPDLDHRRRREVPDRDLDEEVRRSPDRRERPDQEGVGARHRSRTASRPEARRYTGPLTQVAEQPLHRALGLTDGELERIGGLLGREPNHFELAVFSLLWSEHCGYKHSARLLKRLPSTGERVLQGPGENAGVLDLGEGEAVAFKVESHNHPVGGRALPGSGDRRRRHPARHRRDGRAADRAPRRPSLRRAGSRLRPRRRRHRLVRELGRRADRRRRDRLRRGVRGQLPRQRDVRGDPSRRARDAGEGAGPGPPRRALRRDDRPRRDRRRIGARVAGARRGRRRQAAERPGRRSVHRARS